MPSRSRPREITGGCSRPAAWLFGCSLGLPIPAFQEPKPAPTPPVQAGQVPAGEVSPLPGSPALPRDPLLAEKYDFRDSARDTPWVSEVANELSGKQLSALGAVLEHAEEQALSAESLAALAVDEVRFTPLRPAVREQVGSSPAAVVTRARGLMEETTLEGRGALALSLASLVEHFRGGAHAKFKVVEVRLAEPDSAASFETIVYALIDGHGETSELQINATWRIQWRRPSDQAPPRIVALAVLAHEECLGGLPGATLFQDVTQAALGTTEAWQRQFTKGLDRWAGELDASLGGAIVGHEGLALGDFDGDGLDDLYVCQSGGLPNRLLRHLPDGTLVDVSARTGVDFLDTTRSALFLDLDNDGDQDLVLAMDPWIVVLANSGPIPSGSLPAFAIAAKLPGPSVTSLASADVDRDGDLDLYACGYMLPDRHETTPVPYHDANNGKPSLFYRNETREPGKFEFVDATVESGLDQNNRRFSFAASFEDYDDDGDQDLYVANDFGRNNLYRNDGGKFTDVAGTAGVEDIAAGMGVTWADYDGDGRMDLYVSNMFSSAGERITYQRNFRPEFDASTRALFQRHARGNSLFRNLGDGTFEDVSMESGTTMGRWAWGAKFVDFDNDGRPDLFVPNGFVTGEDPADL
jgi:hypothetical protein